MCLCGVSRRLQLRERSSRIAASAGNAALPGERAVLRAMQQGRREGRTVRFLPLPDVSTRSLLFIRNVLLFWPCRGE
jgi:hypothetical protein